MKESGRDNSSLVLIPVHRSGSSNNRYYGGMVICIKNSLRSGITFLQKTSEKVWIKLDKKFFGTKKDIFVCFVYISPKSANNDDKTLFDDISVETEQYSAEGNVIICGDMNAKTNSQNDFVNDAEDHHSPIISNPLYTRAIPTTRKNADPHTVDGWEKLFLMYVNQVTLEF